MKAANAAKPVVEKQMHPAAWVYLHAAVANQMAKCNDKQFMASAPPHVIEREQTRLQELLKRKKSQRGRVWWLLVALCVMAYCSIFIALILKHPGSTYIYTAPVDEWRVIEQMTDYEFVMQRVHNGVPLQPQYVRFCGDYKPLLQIGYTLTYFAFDDHGECISIAAKDRQYNIKRGPDPEGRSGLWPVLPSNCRNLGLRKPVVCDGLPRWSN